MPEYSINGTNKINNKISIIAKDDKEAIEMAEDLIFLIKKKSNKKDTVR